MADQYSQYTYGQQNSAYMQGYSQTTSKPELPRSISMTNLETTRQCQDYVRKDLCVSIPQGGTCFFMELPGYTFTIPHMISYPADFRQFVFDRIIDKTAKKSLEDEKCLNWCQQATTLEPLHTNGDGNCLLHAASLGMWGFQDRANILRSAVSQSVTHAGGRSNTLYERWQYNKQVECKQQGYELDPPQWRQEWDTVVRQASCDPTATATLYSLEEFHVFVLANVLRRPVIMYASQKMRSIHCGGTMQCINFHGVYLPLLWDPNSCKKDPLPLAYQNGHFSALVVIDFAQQYWDGKLVLPLVGCDGYPLPVRFMLPDENPQALLNDYVSTITLSNPTYVRTVPCASLSVNTKPTYYDRLVTAFIEACHNAYMYQQYPYGKAMNDGGVGAGGGANGYPGGSVAGKDGRYGSTATTNTVESSYAVVNKARIQDTYPPGSVEQDGKVKCINNCGMYGDPETAGLCSRCHKKSLDAAREQEAPIGQPRPSTGDSGFLSSASLTMSGSIKCPNCSQPGHPNFLGMCQNCYHAAQIGGPQQGQQQSQPAIQTEYGNRPAQQQQQHNQYGNQSGQPMYGNQRAQPMYGNQQQPLYGNEGDIQPQYGNQGPQHPNDYESLDQFQKPPLPPRSEEMSPPPVPLPRSTASGTDKNKCRTPNCDFFGTAETRFYCSKCFERDMVAILNEADSKNPVTSPAPAYPPAVERPYQPPASQYPPQLVGVGAGVMGYGATPASSQQSPEKCKRCHEYYGSPEYGGLCHGCFRNKTKDDSSPKKCPGCNDFFGSEEYGGMCNGCFMKKTERETAQAGFHNQPPPAHMYVPPSITSQSSVGDLPAPAFNFDQNVSPAPQLPPKPLQGMQTNYTGTPPAQAQNREPYMQPGHPYPVHSQIGSQPPYSQPNARPVPKPRNRTAYTAAKHQQPIATSHTYTAPVAAATNLTPAMAAMNLSNSNPNPSCFLCTGVDPSVTRSYFVCPEHAQQMTKQFPLKTTSQGAVGGAQQQYQSTQAGRVPASVGYNTTQPNMVPHGQYPLTSNAAGPHYGASPAANQQQPYPQASQPQHPTPSHYGGAGGGSPSYNPSQSATNQYTPTPVKPKPRPPPHSGAGNMGVVNPYPQFSSQAEANRYPDVTGQNSSQQNIAYRPGTGYTSGHDPQHTVRGNETAFNNLNTNASGAGISAHQEEMGTAGSGAHPGQSHGIVGGNMGSRAGVIGGRDGSSIGIQAGVPTASNEASGSAPKREKILCRSAGCSFYANKELEGLCSNCYEEYYDVKPPEGSS